MGKFKYLVEEENKKLIRAGESLGGAYLRIRFNEEVKRHSEYNKTIYYKNGNIRSRYEGDNTYSISEEYSYNDNNQITHCKYIEVKKSWLTPENVTEDTYFKYNENGKLIYWERDTKYYPDENKNRVEKEFWEYDDNNKLTYHKYTDGKEEFWKYDNNNLIYRKYTDGNEESWKYDNNNNLTYHKYKDGKEEFWECNKNNKLIYHKDPDGLEYIWNYDKNDRLIYLKYPDGLEEFWEYKDDKAICRFSNGAEEIHTKDEMHRIEPNGNELLYVNGMLVMQIVDEVVFEYEYNYLEATITVTTSEGDKKVISVKSQRLEEI